MTPTHTHQCLGNMLGLQSQKHVSASNVRGRKNVKTSTVSVRTKHVRTHVKVTFKSKRKQSRNRANGTQHTGSLGGGSGPTSSHPAPDSPAHRPALTSGGEAKQPPCQVPCFKENENRTTQMDAFQTLRNNQVNTDDQKGRMEKGLHT